MESGRNAPAARRKMSLATLMLAARGNRACARRARSAPDGLALRASDRVRRR